MTAENSIALWKEAQLFPGKGLRNDEALLIPVSSLSPCDAHCKFMYSLLAFFYNQIHIAVQKLEIESSGSPTLFQVHLGELCARCWRTLQCTDTLLWIVCLYSVCWEPCLEGLDKHDEAVLPVMMFLFNALVSAGGRTSEMN